MQLNQKLPAYLLKTGGLALTFIVCSATGAVGLAAIWLKPPGDDLSKLFFYLLSGGSLSVALVLGWLSFRQRLLRLRQQLTITYLTGTVITILNILIVSNLMFLNAHDQNLLMLLLLFTGSIAIFFSHFLSEQLSKQVEAITTSANRIAGGHFDTRVNPGGSYELAQLARGFNKMAAQLEKAFTTQQEMEQSRKELVAAISHDLRTPLASLQLMTEAVSDGIANEQQTAIFLERMRFEVRYMNGLIEDLFELSQLDAGKLKLKPEQANIGDLISDTLESLRDQAASKQQNLAGEVDEDLPEITIDLHKIQRVLNNLVANAIRYTPQGGSILLKARYIHQCIAVSVSDTGEGVPVSDIERIFEPFYRSERSRGRELGGAGLGLAIARRLVEAHQGKISVESREGQGSIFTFNLPLNQQ